METTVETKCLNKIKNVNEALLLVPKQLWDWTSVSSITYQQKKLKSIYLLDIVHNMLVKYHMQKKETVNLSSEYLRKKYGTFYNFYIKFLVEESILILEKKHISGQRSTIYRLNYHYFQYKHFKSSDAMYIKKCQLMQNLYEQKCQQSPIEEDIRRALKADLYSVTLDVDGAKDYLLAMLASGKLDEVKYLANLTTVEDIALGNRFSVCDPYGRMHTNFTILKKEIRHQFLKIDGLKVTELDIRNSQPSMLISILREHADELDATEYKLYVELCLSGQLYQYLKIASQNVLSLKAAKTLVFGVLFGNNEYCNKRNELFQGCFPTIFEFLRNYKREAGGHKYLAHELQRRESDLIFGKIVSEIKAKYQGIKMFTVHDSIIYPEYFKSYVEEIFHRNILEEFQDILLPN